MKRRNYWVGQTLRRPASRQIELLLNGIVKARTRDRKSILKEAGKSFSRKQTEKQTRVSLLIEILIKMQMQIWLAFK